jgi:hypothetical protein
VKRYLEIKAGKTAREILLSGGFSSDKIKVLAGASGGPKWLVLSGIDRILPDIFKNRKKELYTVGSSIGSWRFAALAQKDPITAIETFEQFYIEQRYSAKPSAEEVTNESYKIIDAFLGKNGARDALNHPFMRMNIISALSKGLSSSERKILLGASFAPLVLLNLLSRSLLGLSFQRIMFSDPRSKPPFAGMKGFGTQLIDLTSDNLRKAIMSSGSIPFAMRGITDINGAPAGVYRDGGVIDYHLDIPFLPDNDGLVLYPHFYHRIVPGWLDKSIPWRRAHDYAMDNTILISPSQEFIDSLPGGKIPDRKDFYTFAGNDAERIKRWREVTKKGKALGEELGEVLSSGKFSANIL